MATRLLILLVLLSLFCVKQVLAVDPVYPLKVSSTNRYLVDQNNAPFLMVGDTPWSLIAQVNQSDADYYLSNRAAKGFNTVLINLIEHQFATYAPRNINQVVPFTGKTFTTPNEPYFAAADLVINLAAQKGIVVLLDPVYVGYGCSSEGWCAEMQAATTTDMQSWGQYVGNRYKNYDNIIWVVGGDTNPSPVKDKLTAFVTGLTSVDTRHLITAHNGRGSMAISPWSGATWLTLNNTYSDYLGSSTLAETAYNRSPTLPFFQVEGWYENEHGMTPQQLRAQAYWTILVGGTGHLFGNCPIWSLGAASNFCDQQSTNWKSYLDSKGAKSMANIVSLFSTIPWHNLIPQTGFGTMGNADYASIAQTADKNLTVVYFPTARTINLSVAGTTARWYDPSNGTHITATGPSFTTPGSNADGESDWVLVLETAAVSPKTGISDFRAAISALINIFNINNIIAGYGH